MHWSIKECPFRVIYSGAPWVIKFGYLRFCRHGPEDWVGQVELILCVTFCDMFGCSLQIRTSLGQHLFEHPTFIFFVNFCYICQQAFGSVCFSVTLSRVDDTAADFGKWGVCSLFYTKWYWVFLSGGVVLNFFRGLFFVIVLTQSFFILGLRLFHSL